MASCWPTPHELRFYGWESKWPPTPKTVFWRHDLFRPRRNLIGPWAGFCHGFWPHSSSWLEKWSNGIRYEKYGFFSFYTSLLSHIVHFETSSTLLSHIVHFENPLHFGPPLLWESTFYGGTFKITLFFIKKIKFFKNFQDFTYELAIYPNST